jgi:hypothetical protein
MNDRPTPTSARCDDVTVLRRGTFCRADRGGDLRERESADKMHLDHQFRKVAAAYLSESVGGGAPV